MIEDQVGQIEDVLTPLTDLSVDPSSVDLTPVTDLLQQIHTDTLSSLEFFKSYSVTATTIIILLLSIITVLQMLRK